MTGRRLYDIHCDAHRACSAKRFVGMDEGWVSKRPLTAWPFLPEWERKMWSTMAARLKGVRR